MATKEQIDDIPVPLLVDIIKGAKATPSVEEVEMMSKCTVREMGVFFDARSSGKPDKEIYDVVIGYIRARKDGVDAKEAAKRAKEELADAQAKEAAEAKRKAEEKKLADEAAAKKKAEDEAAAAKKAEDDANAAKKALSDAESARRAALPRRPAHDNCDVIIDDQGDELVLTMDHKVNLDKAALVKFDFSKSENFKFVAADSAKKGDSDFKCDLEVKGKGESPIGKLVIVDKSKNSGNMSYQVMYMTADRREAAEACGSSSTTTTTKTSSAKASPPAEAPEEDDEVKQINENLRMIIKSKNDGYEVHYENSEESAAYKISMDFAKSENLKVSTNDGARLEGMVVTQDFVPAAKGKFLMFAKLVVDDFSKGSCELNYTMTQKKVTK